MNGGAVSVGGSQPVRRGRLALVYSHGVAAAAVDGAHSFGAASEALRPIRLAPGDAAGLARALSETILASRTASEALYAWCVARRLGAGPIRAVKQARTNPAWPDQDALEALCPQLDEAIECRRVLLIRGRAALTESDNWFFPGRLVPPVRALLQATDVPFGAAIAPQHPSRVTTCVTYPPLPAPRDGFVELAPSTVVLEHKAVVLDWRQRPLAAVHERYRASLLSIG